MGMYWGDFKTAVLGKVFSSKRGTISATSKNNLDYVVMMPQAANEGLAIIGNAARWPRRNVQFSVEKKDKSQSFSIEDIAQDFKRVGGFEIYTLDEDEVPYPLYGASISANRIIIPAGVSGDVVWYYDGAYDRIEDNVKDRSYMDIDDDVLTLLVLYVASQIYMDDDLTTALNWRNQFESALDRMSGNPAARETQEFSDLNGW